MRYLALAIIVVWTILTVACDDSSKNDLPSGLYKCETGEVEIRYFFKKGNAITKGYRNLGAATNDLQKSGLSATEVETFILVLKETCRGDYDQYLSSVKFSSKSSSSGAVLGAGGSGLAGGVPTILGGIESLKKMFRSRPKRVLAITNVVDFEDSSNNGIHQQEFERFLQSISQSADLNGPKDALDDRLLSMQNRKRDVKFVVNGVHVSDNQKKLASDLKQQGCELISPRGSCHPRSYCPNRKPPYYVQLTPRSGC